MGVKQTSAYSRMVPRLRYSDESDCLEWQGATNEAGYGVIGRGGRSGGNVLTHRLMWETKVGPIPDGLCVLHDCDNPPCVRMTHLFLGDRADNNADMRAKGRHPMAKDPSFLIRFRWGSRP